jgi:hypothetical protein
MIRNLFFIALVFCNVVYSQQYTKSPWSEKGLGEEDYTGNASFTALGDAKAVYVDSTVLNIYNPASYSFLSHGQPIFSTGGYVQNYQFTQNGITSKNNTLALSHIAFGVSFANRFGLAFGLRPFTNTGYDLQKSNWNGLDTITTQLYGSGNLSYAFAGFSLKVLNFEKHKLAFGVNLGSVFGTNLQRQTVHIQDEKIGSIKQSTLKVNGFSPEFGFNYQLIFNKSSNILFSGVYKLNNTFTGESKTALISAADFKNENTFDTLDYSTLNGEIMYPSYFEFGFKYDFTKYANRSSLKIPQILLLASYKAVNWKEYTSLTTENLLNTSSYQLGLQFAPHVDFYDRSKAISFFSRIRYRVGYQYAQLPWDLNGKQGLSQSFSAGFGMPILSQRTLSSLNFAVSYGFRNNGISTDFSEKTLGFSLGITISPAFYDRWFRKNKID